MALAGSLLVFGLVISLAGALLWRSSVRMRDRQSFQTVAAGVTGTVDTLLRRDTDFVATLRAVLDRRPGLSATGFSGWYTDLEGDQRQVGNLGTAIIKSVPAAGLAAFQRRRDADPAFRVLVGGSVARVSARRRARYCLLAGGDVSTPYSQEIDQLVQGDWCDPRSTVGGYPAGGVDQAALLQSLADSGRLLVYPLALEGASTFFIEGAFYRRGVTLATVAERRAALLGWVSSSFDTFALIRSALRGQRHIAMALYHIDTGHRPELMGEAGAAVTAGSLTHQVAVQINGTWIVKVIGASAVGGLSANVQGLLVMLAGTLVSLLLCALVLVLTRSREHALGMVKEKTGELRHQALHDALTDMPNRLLALDRAEQMLARARRESAAAAVLYVDVDGFKQVNDTFGHAVGDALLRIVATRLAGVVRGGDTAARVGGDEFVVLVDGTALDAGPELVAERVLEVLCQPYDMTSEIGRQLTLTASVGIASGVDCSAEDLLRDADLARYEAKAAGRNRYVLFESGMQAIAQDRLSLQMDLAEALERDELFLRYQPIFDLASETVIGAEALIRWRHPTRGVLSPDKFIPIAEQSGLIVPIGRWVLQEACHRAGVWHDHGHNVGIAVNVSARQLDADELIDDVQDALQTSGLDAGSLTVEVTETTIMRDAEATAKRLRRLKEIGVRIAIDDFGTGYSSLAYLRQFPADALKIDRSFVSGIAASAQTTALIRTLVQLGKALNIETLAEGIEDQSQLETLQREHCDQGQGFLFSRPLDVDAIEAFLQTGRPTRRARSTIA